MADVFEALATPARRAILDELYDRDGQTLFELCARLTMKHGLGLTRQAISQHLDVLESAGLVARKGRTSENRGDERLGRRPGQGVAVLHRRARFREEDGSSDGRGPVADRRG